MTSGSPNFSPYPFARLRKLRARDAAIESALARWIAARPLGACVAALAGGPVRVEVLGIGAARVDPHAALAEVRIAGASIVLAASSGPVRALAQRLLGGPEELAAPRPLTPAEHAVWALAVAAAIEDTRVAAEVWPCIDPPPAESLDLELLVDVAGSPMTVVARCPPGLPLRVAPARPVPGWRFAVPVVVGGCSLSRASLAGLAVRDVITIEPRLALVIGTGSIGLSSPPNAVEAEVTTGYVPRDMPAIADEARLELTVQLGTTELSLRQLADLAPGQVVALGRPLAGPFEVHAAGRLVAHGELVDVEGEVGVRIVSLQE